MKLFIELFSEAECSENVFDCFILDIWSLSTFCFTLQIVECRRVLKWTYAYGYYLAEHEHAKKQFFEYLQGFLFCLLSIPV